MDSRTFYFAYDLDATTYKYGAYLEPVEGGGASGYGLTTAGSSTTVTSVAGTPMDPVTVGDRIWFFKPDGTILKRKITAKASGASITVDSAVDLSTAISKWVFEPFRIGTAATDGWINVGQYGTKTVFMSATIAAGTTGGMDLTIEGRLIGQEDSEAKPITLISLTNFAANASHTRAWQIVEAVRSIRVGIKGNSAFGGTDDINIYFEGVR